MGCRGGAQSGCVIVRRKSEMSSGSVLIVAGFGDLERR